MSARSTMSAQRCRWRRRGATWTCQPPSAVLATWRTPGVGEDLGAVAHGVGQIGERDRVLGADVAAAAAVAAARAGGLLDAGRIDRVGSKLTATGGATGAVAERGAGRLPAPCTSCSAAGARIARGPQPALGPAVALVEQAVLGDLARARRSSANTRASGRSATPALISEPPPRPQPTSTCMSSPRRTSKSAVVGPVRRRLPVTCISFLQVGEAGGELAGQDLAPALEHGDRLPARDSREAATPPP